MDQAQAIFFAIQIWCMIGMLVCILFLIIGIDRVDEDAHGAYVFRLLLIPAILLIWPLVLWRWFVLETGRDQWQRRHEPPRHSHFWIAIIFAITIPGIIILGLSQRQTWPGDFQPQKISLQTEAGA